MLRLTVSIRDGATSTAMKLTQKISHLLRPRVLWSRRKRTDWSGSYIAPIAHMMQSPPRQGWETVWSIGVDRRCWAIGFSIGPATRNVSPSRFSPTVYVCIGPLWIMRQRHNLFGSVFPITVL